MGFKKKGGRNSMSEAEKMKRKKERDSQLYFKKKNMKETERAEKRKEKDYQHKNRKEIERAAKEEKLKVLNNNNLKKKEEEEERASRVRLRKKIEKRRSRGKEPERKVSFHQPLISKRRQKWRERTNRSRQLRTKAELAISRKLSNRLYKMALMRKRKIVRERAKSLEAIHLVDHVSVEEDRDYPQLIELLKNLNTHERIERLRKVLGSYSTRWQYLGKKRRLAKQRIRIPGTQMKKYVTLHAKGDYMELLSVERERNGPRLSEGEFSLCKVKNNGNMSNPINLKLLVPVADKVINRLSSGYSFKTEEKQEVEVLIRKLYSKRLKAQKLVRKSQGKILKTIKETRSLADDIADEKERLRVMAYSLGGKQYHIYSQEPSEIRGAVTDYEYLRKFEFDEYGQGTLVDIDVGGEDEIVDATTAFVECDVEEEPVAPKEESNLRLRKAIDEGASLDDVFLLKIQDELGKDCTANEESSSKNTGSGKKKKREWPETLMNCLEPLEGSKSYDDLIERVIRFDQCRGCADLTDISECQLGVHCESGMRLVHKLRIHFAGIRTLCRELDYLKSCVKVELEAANKLAKGTLDEIEEFVSRKDVTKCLEESNQVDMIKEDIRYFAGTEESIKTEHAASFEKFNRTITDWPTRHCESCLRFTKDDNLKTCDLTEERFDVLQSYLETKTGVEKRSGLLCKYCIDSYNKYPSTNIPPMSIINKMDVDVTPLELRGLNPTERMLTQRYHSHFFMLKLMPLSKKQFPGKRGMKAMKGLAYFYPVSLQDTLNITSNVMPNHDWMFLFVDSKGKDDKIWRSIVSKDKVVQALNWLKQNNSDYASIEIKWDDEALFKKIVKTCKDNASFEDGDANSGDDFENSENEDDDLSANPTINNTSSKPNHSSASNFQQPSRSDDIVGQGKSPVFVESTVSSTCKPSSETDSKPDHSSASNYQQPSTSVDTVGHGKSPVFVESTVRSTSPSDSASPSMNTPSDNVKKPWLKHMGNSAVIHQSYSLMPMHQINSDYKDVEVFMRERNENENLAKDGDPKVETMTFPHLFPRNRYHFADKRKCTINITSYAKQRLTCVEPQFRRDDAFIFGLASKVRKHNINACAYFNGNNVLGGMSAGQLLSEAKISSGYLDRNLNAIFAKLRGSPQYWKQQYTELRCRIMDWGPPHLFLTLNVSEYNMPDVIECLDHFNKDIKDFQNLSPGEKCAADTVSVQLQLKRRLEAVKNLLFKEGKPFGPIAHHYIRVEYQQRGMKHYHILLWLDRDFGITKEMDKSSPEYKEVREYLLSKITVRLPDRHSEPELYKLVTQHQMHSCGSTCFKNQKRVFHSLRCRFGYPRPAAEDLVFNSVKDTVKSRYNGQHVKRYYDLPRTSEECYINDYNPLLLLAWKSNMDISFVFDGDFALAHYLTKYVTKTEDEEVSELWDSISKSDKSTQSKIQSLGHALCKNRSASIMECVDLVMGEALHSSDTVVKYITLGRIDERKKQLKQKKDLLKMDPGDTNIFVSNLIDVGYPKRPDEMEGETYFEVFKNYEYTFTLTDAEKNDHSKRNPRHLYMKDNAGKFTRRVIPKVANIPQVYGDSAEDLERKCFYALQLFTAWRCEDDIYAGCANAKEAFKKRCIADDLQYKKDKRLRDTFINVSTLIANWRSEAEKAQMVDEADVNPDMTEFVPVDYGVEGFFDNYLRLNDGQRKIVDKVLKGLYTQVCTSDENASTSKPKSPQELRMFISGVAGTGKSFVIKTIVGGVNLFITRKSVIRVQCFKEFIDQIGSEPSVELLKKLDDQLKNDDVDGDDNEDVPSGVCIGALSALAAKSVGGVTLHKTFKLAVTKSKRRKDADIEISDMLAKALHEFWKHIKVLIIDEISMVSKQVLEQIHHRLQRILRNDSRPFGGVNVLVFGDLLQLQPVQGDVVYHPPDAFSPKLWRGISHRDENLCISPFDYYELTENMRQREQLSFAEMLGRIRIGEPNDQDLKDLHSRIMLSPEEQKNYIENGVKVFLQLRKDGKCPRAQFHTNAEVDAFNDAVAKEMGFDNIIIVEKMDDHDILNTKMKKNKKTGKSGKQAPVSDTGGLPAEVKIAEGMEIMIRRNINSKRVNGSFGVIQKINFRGSFVDSLVVKYDDDNEEEVLQRVTGRFEDPNTPAIYIQRTQFPIAMAYAITNHKSQGQTLEDVVLDLGPGTTTPNMAYVALSRATKLSGIHLLRFCPTSIKASQKGITEYNRLRASVKMQMLSTQNQYEIRQRLTQFIPSEFPRFYPVTKKAQTQICTKAMEAMDVENVCGLSQQAKPPPKKKVHVQSTAPPTVEYLKLENDSRVNCYANSLVQCLSQCSQFVDVLKRPSFSSSQIGTCLNELYNESSHEILSVNELRHAVGGDFANDNQQQDPGEFAVRLLEKLDEADESFKPSSMFAVNMQPFFKCSVCDDREFLQQEQWYYFPLMTLKDEDGILQSKSSFRDMVKQSEVTDVYVTRRCPTCRTDTRHRQYHDFSLMSDTKYLIITLALFTHVRGYIPPKDKSRANNTSSLVRIPKREIHGLCPGTAANRKNIPLFGANFRVLAAIAHQGSYQAAHYVSWIIKDGKWICIDDLSPSLREIRKELPKALKDISMIILEKQ